MAKVEAHDEKSNATRKATERLAYSECKDKTEIEHEQRRAVLVGFDAKGDGKERVPTLEWRVCARRWICLSLAVTNDRVVHSSEYVHCDECTVPEDGAFWMFHNGTWLRRWMNKFPLMMLSRDTLCLYMILLSIGGSNKIRRMNQTHVEWLIVVLILSYRFSVLLVYYLQIDNHSFVFAFAIRQCASERENSPVLWHDWNSLDHRSNSDERIYRRMITVHIFCPFVVFIASEDVRGLFTAKPTSNVNVNRMRMEEKKNGNRIRTRFVVGKRTRCARECCNTWLRRIIFSCFARARVCVCCQLPQIQIAVKIDCKW